MTLGRARGPARWPCLDHHVHSLPLGTGATKVMQDINRFCGPPALQEAENMLAEVGLISTVLTHGEMGVGYGR